MGNTFEAPVFDTIDLNKDTKMSVMINPCSAHDSEPTDEWMDSIDEAVELDVPVKSLTPTFADVQLLEATENSEGESINANLDNLPQEANDFDFDFSEEEDDDSSFF
jgi:hypothetical protein